VEDAAALLQVIAGDDDLDSTCAPVAVPDYRAGLTKDISDMTIGLPKEYFAEGLDSEIRAATDACVAMLRKQGASVVEVSLPHTDYAIATYYVLTTAEASSNLSRYDGARYGVRAEDSGSLEDMYVNSRSQGFGDEVKRRIMLGTYVLSAGYYDAYYRKAQKVRTLIKNDFNAAFEKCDCLLTPAAPTTAFRIGEKTDDPLTMYLSDIYTVSVNLAGVPGISVPWSQDSKGLPIGIQIIGKHFDEQRILNVAKVIESNKEKVFCETSNVRRET
jgi:aspartyl-tRNA(Asn)/glutamyl-tRNA(Gln) amidotransferase subunit A